jgi:hypothetical protein
MTQHEELRRQLEADIKRFLRKKGVVQQLPPAESKKKKYAPKLKRVDTFDQYFAQ